MDGVAAVAGLGGVVELGGRQWIVKGRTVGFYALLESEILRMRGDPFAMVVEAAKQHKDDPIIVDIVAATIAERFRNWRMATYSDYAQFFRTPYGSAFQIWAAIHDQDPNLSIEQVRFWLLEEIGLHGEDGMKKRDEIMAAIDKATGTDPLGNSTGPRLMPQTAGA